MLLPFRVIGRSTVTGLSQSPTSVTRPGTGTLTCCAAFKLNGLYSRKPKKHFRPQRPLLGARHACQCSPGARNWKAGASSLQLSLVLLVCLESAGGRRAWAALLCSSAQSEATQRASRCHRALLDRQALRAVTCHGRLRLQVCRRCPRPIERPIIPICLTPTACSLHGAAVVARIERAVWTSHRIRCMLHHRHRSPPFKQRHRRTQPATPAAPVARQHLRRDPGCSAPALAPPSRRARA